MANRRLPDDIVRASLDLTFRAVEDAYEELLANPEVLASARYLTRQRASSANVDSAVPRNLNLHRSDAALVARAIDSKRGLDLDLDLDRARNFVRSQSKGSADEGLVVNVGEPDPDIVRILDSAPVLDLPLGRKIRREFATYAKDDFGKAHDKLSVGGDLGGQYYAYLLVLWAAQVAVTWAASVEADEPETEERRASEQLSPEATTVSSANLEGFTTATQRWIDDPAATLGEVDESFIRAELEVIRSQHRVIEGADAYYVRRAVGKIVHRLLTIEIVGEQAKAVLVSLAPEPPEIVDEIVNGMGQFMRELADTWAEAALEPASDPVGSAAPFESAADNASSIEASIQSAPGLAEQAREKFLLGIPDGAGKTIGGAAAGAGLGVVGALAVAVTRMPGIDAIALWLIEAAPKLLDIYTYRTAKSSNRPGQKPSP